MSDEKSTDSKVYRLRHSLAHVLANAAVELWPQTRYAVGPATEHGFYYDLEVRDADGQDVRVSEADLKKLQKRMKRIIARGSDFVCETVSHADAVAYWTEQDQTYKVSLLESISDEEITYYRHGDFVDLCKGPHVQNTRELKHFMLRRTSGAYWRGNTDLPQLQRIFGIAFETHADLDAHLHWLKEAERRDHRKLGKRLDLFHFEEEAGRGLPFFHPDAALMRAQLARFLEDEHLAHGYQLVGTPYIMKADLWRKTGHYEHYAEMMYLLEKDGIEYAIKPMNCPGHALIYRHTSRSYRDLPIRYYEFGQVLRAEYSGTVHGLMRARLFTQDDAHIFCTPGQLEEEIGGAVDFAIRMLALFGFQFEVGVATRPEEGTVGSDEAWEAATGALFSALKTRELGATTLDGDGAFYGPKIEFALIDALGRRWTGPTVQVDFNLAPSLEATYVDSSGMKQHPVVVHRVVVGSWERFLGIALEHFAGDFPVWFCATQVEVVPVSATQSEYAREVCDFLRSGGIRANRNLNNDTLGAKIRAAERKRIPYCLIVGEREVASKTVSVRTRGSGDLGTMSTEDFRARVQEKIESKGFGL